MFTIIDRYILRSTFAPFIFGASTVVFIYLMQFLMRYLDQLVGKGLDTWIILQLIALSLAWMVVLAVPVGALFASLMAFGSMSAVHEITIIKASGTSLFRMMRPAALAGILLSVALFWFNDNALPDANHQSKNLLADIKRKKPTFALEGGQFSTQLEGYTILARRVDSLTGNLYSVTIYDNTNAAYQNIVSADSGIIKTAPHYDKYLMTLFHGEVHQAYVNRMSNYKIIRFETYRIAIDAGGFEFERTAEGMTSRSDREMRISEMRAVAAESRNLGMQARRRLDSALAYHLNALMDGEKYPAPPERTEPRPTLRNMPLPGEAIPRAPRRAAPLGNPLRGRGAAIGKRDSALQAQALARLRGETERDSIRRTLASARRLAAERVANLRSEVLTNKLQYEDMSRRADQYEVEIQKKYAIPFACFLFVIVGCPLGVITRGGNFGLSAGYSLLFYIFYWACLIGGEKLADRGIMNPFWSMWLGNILIGIIGVVLAFRVNYESYEFLGINRVVRFFARILKRTQKA